MKKVIFLLLTTIGANSQILERITPVNPMNVYSFGNAIAYHQNDFVVGGFDGPPPTGNFRYYAFEKTTSGFNQNQIILPPEVGENFGTAVEIENDFLFIGSPHNSSLIANGGAVYVFKKNGTNWNFLTKIQPSSLTNGENFGSSILSHDNQVLIGASNYDSNGNLTDNNGAIYVYDKVGDNFTFSQILSITTNKNLGQFIDAENNFLISTNLNTSNEETKVVSYQKQSNLWNFVNEFNVGNLGYYKNSKVNYSNNQLFISRNGDPTINPVTRGIEIYNLQSNNWVFESLFEHSIGDYFEASINVDNNKMIISALGNYILQIERKNRALLYKRVNTNWTLINSYNGQSSYNDDNFGNLSKIKGENIVFSNSTEIWQYSPFGYVNGGAYFIDATLQNQSFLSKDVYVYPNPVQTKLHISNTSELDINEVVITDTNGRILLKTKSVNIDFSQFSRGIYFIKINFADGNIYTKKILKN
jgi:hypothetical protein